MESFKRVRIDLKPLFHLVYIIIIAEGVHMPIKCVVARLGSSS